MGMIELLGIALALVVNAHRADGVDRPFVVQPGGRVAPLASGPNLARVRLSPDGRLVAGVAPDGSLRVLRLDGTVRRRITAVEEFDWAPDSRRFVVVRGRARRHVQVVSLKPAPPRELTPPNDAAWPRSRYGKVSWDPAGRWIGYYRELDDEVHYRYGAEYDAVHPDGTGARALFSVGTPFKDAPYILSWSPRGGRLLVVTGTFGRDTPGTAVIDVATGDLTQPVPYDSGVGGAAWSPDGTRLALIRDGQLITVDPRGRGRRVLASSLSAAPLAWSRDGRRIFYAVGRRLLDVSVGGGAPQAYATLPARWEARDLW
jgi:dipeptidyl aminopeptidase/acylaminoacyl peptidase